MRKFRVVVNGNTYEVDIEEIGETAGGELLASPTPVVTQSRKAVKAPAVVSQKTKSIANETDKTVVAQMPGTIVDVRVKPGDTVERGQALLILEAMKMANEVVAPYDGSVVSINVEKDTSVNAGDVLVVLN